MSNPEFKPIAAQVRECKNKHLWRIVRMHKQTSEEPFKSEQYTDGPLICPICNDIAVSSENVEI